MCPHRMTRPKKLVVSCWFPCRPSPNGLPSKKHGWVKRETKRATLPPFFKHCWFHTTHFASWIVQSVYLSCLFFEKCFFRQTVFSCLHKLVSYATLLGQIHEGETATFPDQTSRPVRPNGDKPRPNVDFPRPCFQHVFVFVGKRQATCTPGRFRNVSTPVFL